MHTILLHMVNYMRACVVHINKVGSGGQNADTAISI